MDLTLTGIGKYSVTTERVRPYRDAVTVLEVDTGKSWTEPFDTTGKGDVLQLQSRFQRCIDTGEPPPKIAISSIDDPLVNEAIAKIGRIAYEVAEMAAYNAAQMVIETGRVRKVGRVRSFVRKLFKRGEVDV